MNWLFGKFILPRGIPRGAIFHSPTEVIEALLLKLIAEQEKGAKTQEGG